MNHETDSVVCECDLPDPPEKVWRALTVPELLAQWLLPNDMRPEVGVRFHLGGEDSGEDAVECEVLEARPNELLRYTWRTAANESDGEGPPLDSIVTFELTRTAVGGTHLRIVHDAFAESARARITCTTASVQTNVVPLASRTTCALQTQAQGWLMPWAA